MELKDLTIGLRVRIPAFEKEGPGGERTYHYAYVRDIVDSCFGDEKTVLVSIPALKIDKAVHPATLFPARKAAKRSKKEGEKK